MDKATATTFEKLVNLFTNDLSNASEMSAHAIAEALKLLDDEKDKLEKIQKAKEEAEKKAAEEAEKKRQQEKARIKKITSMELPMDWENAFNNDSRAEDLYVEHISDGLILSLSNLGKVDIEYIAEITKQDCRTVIKKLQGSIYQNPTTWEECFYKGWETADEYLSGYLMPKLDVAKRANKKYDGYFQSNVDALIRSLPDPIATEDIYITLGSPWVPVDVIDDFIEHVFGEPTERYFKGHEDITREINKTKHDEITGTWEIPNKNRYQHNIGVAVTYGTKRLEALHILEKTLNMRTLVVKDNILNQPGSSGRKKVVNQSETALVQEKQKKLISEFQEWVWKDPQRSERLQIIFENRYSCALKRKFDGSFLEFPTMSKTATLYPFQKDAVARIIFSKNTLLAHDVGSGKTYEMIAAAMEMKRMGLSKKNMFVVPNNITDQWKNVFLELYPEARLLCVTPNQFKPKKRDQVLRQIKENDYDGIIIPYSCFEKIPLSKQYYLDKLNSEKQKIIEAIKDDLKSTKRLSNKKATIQKAIDNVVASIATDEGLESLSPLLDDVNEGLFFDDLGITRLFVDEAHNFKNIPYETKASNVLGISNNSSARCKDMLDKVHFVQSMNDGGGVVFATGTPITNSITDAFAMQSYLQYGALSLMDLQNFDSWIGMFAEQLTDFEVDVDTSSYRMATRFSKFHNLPELTTLFAQIADFHQIDSSAGIPEHDGYSDVLIKKTPEFENFLMDISSRADAVRNRRVYCKTDNMLLITTDGRKAALDMRLIDPSLNFSFQSKVARCAQNIYEHYLVHSEKKCAQIVFCDTSTPKFSFNLYDDLKRILCDLGIPDNEIAFVHDAKTESQRKSLFEDVRNGKVRVLIGSTFKLGLGVNIQERLIALHHLDVPWRPSDMTQREGRILRQGNTNSQVYIYRYITEGSFDSYSWQLLETKQRFIVDLLSGSMGSRSSSDVDDVVLDYAEVKALAVGNPLVKERVEALNQLNRYRALQHKVSETKLQLVQEKNALPAELEEQADLISLCKEDLYFASTSTASKADPSTLEGRAYRADVRSLLSDALSKNKYALRERILMDYRGFQIFLPSNMTPEKPYVWLQHFGRYKVDLGDSSSGYLVRIDNRIDSLDSHLEKLKKVRDSMLERGRYIEEELKKDEDYITEIEVWESKVESLDIALGIK